MPLRPEVLPPGPPRAHRNPIPVILGLLLIATFASAAHENRQLRQRAEAAEEREARAAAEAEALRLQREIEAVTEQIAALREAFGEAEFLGAEGEPMGDFPTPPRVDRWGHGEPTR